jgi:hypothetical protein
MIYDNFFIPPKRVKYKLFCFFPIYTGQQCFEDIKQSFSIMDVPGGWFNYKERPPDQWEIFDEHLKTSAILWVPIDSVLLNEAETSEEKRESILRLITTDIRDSVEKWAKYRSLNEHKGDAAILCFVPIKCETYFSQSKNKKRRDNLYKLFLKEYTESITGAKVNCPDCRIYYAPVETIGCIKLREFVWDVKYKLAIKNILKIFIARFSRMKSKNNNQANISYKIIPPGERFIEGIDVLALSMCTNKKIKELYWLIENLISEKNDRLDYRLIYPYSTISTQEAPYA